VSNNGIVGNPYIGDQVLAVGTNPFYVADTNMMETWLLIVIISGGALFLIISVLIIYCCCCKKS
jgi:hypothetical protein